MDFTQLLDFSATGILAFFFWKVVEKLDDISPALEKVKNCTQNMRTTLDSDRDLYRELFERIEQLRIAQLLEHKTRGNGDNEQQRKKSHQNAVLVLQRPEDEKTLKEYDTDEKPQ